MKTSSAPQTSDPGKAAPALLLESLQAEHTPAEKKPAVVAAEKQPGKAAIASEGWGFFNWDGGGW